MASRLVEAIMDDIHQQADPEQGMRVASYMKTSKIQFLGVSVTVNRKMARKRIKGVSIDHLIPIMEELWEKPVFDYRLAAIEIMEKYSLKGDIGTSFGIIDEWIDDIDTWSLIDPLCIVCLGYLIIRDRSVEKQIAKWRKSENFWRRRATILPGVQLAKKKSHRPEYNQMILEWLIPHLGDSEFFIAKAVGWVLRELSKREPELVRTFIEKHKDRMRKLSIREGSKKL